MTPLIDCQTAANLMPLYISGELDAHLMLKFEAHCDVCARCLRRLETERATDNLLREAANEQQVNTEQLRSKLLRQIYSFPAKQIYRQKKTFRSVSLAAAAAVLLIFIAGGFLMSLKFWKQSSVPIMLAAAVFDHREDVVRQTKKDGWREDEAEIKHSLQQLLEIKGELLQFNSAGYRVRKMRVCNLMGKPFVHLVIVRLDEPDLKEAVSLFIQRQIIKPESNATPAFAGALDFQTTAQIQGYQVKQGRQSEFQVFLVGKDKLDIAEQFAVEFLEQLS